MPLYDSVDMPPVLDDKLLSVCVYEPSPTKESLEEIPLIELDGSYEGEKGSTPTKKKLTSKESTDKQSFLGANYGQINL